MSTEGVPVSTDTTASEGAKPLVIDGVEGLRARVGTELGVSEWVTIDQESVNTFARLTGDGQWIHVDPERAKDGPFGGTVAHGFMTLGMSTGLLWNVAVVDRVAVVLNYGLNRVRFPAPVRVGSRLRMRVSVAELKDLPGGIEAVYHLEYELDGEAKPPCVADLVFRYYT
jgi:acyl dehydratase